jgi:hypothetical protein
LSESALSSFRPIFRIWGGIHHKINFDNLIIILRVGHVNLKCIHITLVSRQFFPNDRKKIGDSFLEVSVSTVEEKITKTKGIITCLWFQPIGGGRICFHTFSEKLLNANNYTTTTITIEAKQIRKP